MNNVKISSFINTGLKEFSLYTLTSRGIPNFYDSLTPIQRLIVTKTPNYIEKTPSVIGEVMKNYHHGDMSVIGAINKLARPFGCSEPIIIGDGNFGTQVIPAAAAPRYTSINLNPIVGNIIKESSFLNTKTLDGSLEPLHIKFPISLLTTIVGISIGYKSQILPRKYEEILNFLEDRPSDLTPYFRGFTGKITKIPEHTSGWLFEGNCVVSEKWKTIRILDIPPILNYSQFINRLSKAIEFVKVDIENNSKSNIDILLKFRDPLTKELIDSVVNSTKVTFKESIIFIKDDNVLRYDTISDYLKDFKNKNLTLDLKILNYNLSKTSDELEFQQAKLDFLLFMIKTKRTNSEVDTFLSKYSDKISNKLDNIKLRNLTQEDIAKVKSNIIDIKNDIKQITKNIKSKETQISKTNFTLNDKKFPLIETDIVGEFDFDADDYELDPETIQNED